MKRRERKGEKRRKKTNLRGSHRIQEGLCQSTDRIEDNEELVDLSEDVDEDVNRDTLARSIVGVVRANVDISNKFGRDRDF